MTLPEDRIKIGVTSNHPSDKSVAWATIPVDLIIKRNPSFKRNRDGYYNIGWQTPRSIVLFIHWLKHDQILDLSMISNFIYDLYDLNVLAKEIIGVSGVADNMIIKTINEDNITLILKYGENTQSQAIIDACVSALRGFSDDAVKKVLLRK